MMSKKILLITNIPSPYRIPLFNRMHKDFAANGFNLKVIFLTRTYARRKWTVNESEFEFDYEYLKDPYIAVGEGFTSLSATLPIKLYHEKPALVVVGGFTIPTIWVNLYCRMMAVPYAVWSGETQLQSMTRFELLHLRTALRRFLARQASGAIAYGTYAKSYLESLGIETGKIFIGINTVDTDFFRTATEAERLKKSERIRALNLPEHNILYVGNLTRDKGIHCLLKSYKLIESKIGSVALHIVGDGNYMKSLIALTDELDLKNVKFWGFKQKSELPFFYAISDLFVFPSFYDVWGLVCIEAMSAGLPVLSSSQAGITQDLIRDGYNGYQIEPSNYEDFGNKMMIILQNSAFRQTLASNASETVQQRFLITHSSFGFLQAVRRLLEK
jgi:glycosyltransferase involved in cell wall biosynthesis